MVVRDRDLSAQLSEAKGRVALQQGLVKSKDRAGPSAVVQVYSVGCPLYWSLRHIVASAKWLSPTSWHSPSTSPKIKLRASTVAELQHLLKRVQGGTLLWKKLAEQVFK